MKNPTDYRILNVIAFIVVCLVASATCHAAGTPASTPTTGEVFNAGKVGTIDKSPAVIAVEKERDDAKAQVAQLTQQNQQQQIVAEYYKAVAEKNDAVLRIVALQQELQAVKAELAAAQAELATLKKVPEAKK